MKLISLNPADFARNILNLDPPDCFDVRRYDLGATFRSISLDVEIPTPVPSLGEVLTFVP